MKSFISEDDIEQVIFKIKLPILMRENLEEK